MKNQIHLRGIEFLKPIAGWYRFSDKSQFSPEVQNAFDSLLAYFEGTGL